MARHAKKSDAQFDREVAAALAGHAQKRARGPLIVQVPTLLSLVNDQLADNEGVFYLTDTKEQPLGPEFRSRLAAKRAAMKLVREGARPVVEVWHRWRGDRYMQGRANEDGWSDV